MTKNQNNLLGCLEKDYLKLKEICKRYAVIQAGYGYSSNPYIWSSEVSRILNTLIKRDLVKWKKGGYYKLTNR